MKAQDGLFGLVAVVLLLALLAGGAAMVALPALQLANAPAVEAEAGVTPTARVLHNVDSWRAHMERWEEEYDVPFAVQYALMTVESGGQPDIVGEPIEWRGGTLRAMGLFQVMPFDGRFAPGENPFDPDTNAREGLGWLTACNHRAGHSWDDEDVLRRTFACYFGGSPSDPSKWGPKTRNYADAVLSLYRSQAGKVVQPLQDSPVAMHALGGEVDNNYCFRDDIDCAYSDNPGYSDKMWVAGYWLGRGWLADDMRSQGLHEIADLADCLQARKSATLCKEGGLP